MLFRSEKIVPYSTGSPALGFADWADSFASRLILRGLGVNKPSKLSVVAPSGSDPSTTKKFLVQVAKGEQFTIEMSSTVRSTLVGHFGLARLLKERVPAPPGLPARLGRIGKGANRLVTPPMVLKVVHAVRRPLAEPKILTASPTATRGIGQTFADFGARMTCHPQSTSQIDWNLTWNEWVDRPGDEVGSPPSDRPRIVEEIGRAHV